MKNTGRRSVVIYIMTSLYVLGLAWFLLRYTIDGKKWASSYINNHVAKSGKLMQAGKITDRNGVILAQTVQNRRVYNENKNVREAMLHTVGDGGSAIETAVQNKYRHEIVGYNPITGLALNSVFDKKKDIKLTLDSNICTKVQQKFGNKNGTALLYNYKTGEILCMVSTPTFDPYNPPEIDMENPGKYEGVYLNKALSASFPPGSIFKIITAAAAIENITDIYNRTFQCDSVKKVGSGELTCVYKHGKLGIKDAFAKSCNIAFGELAMEIGADKMENMANLMGFNRNLSICDIDLKKSHYEAKDADAKDLAWSGSGQYKDLVNPMHMALILGAIANGGIPVTPYMVDNNSNFWDIIKGSKYNKFGQRFIKTKTAEKLKELMRYAVKTQYSDSMFPGLSVCAKTGTAEVGKEHKPTAWMVGFTDDVDVPLVFVVAVENAGLGIEVSAPIVQTMLALGRNLYRK